MHSQYTYENPGKSRKQVLIYLQYGYIICYLASKASGKNILVGAFMVIRVMCIGWEQNKGTHVIDIILAYTLITYIQPLQSI